MKTAGIIVTVGLVSALAACGGSTSSAKAVVTPTASASRTPVQQDTDWLNTTGRPQLAALLGNLELILGGTLSDSQEMAACSNLAGAVGKSRAVPAPPTTIANRDWTEALSGLAQGAGDCSMPQFDATTTADDLSAGFSGLQRLNTDLKDGT